MEMVTRTIICYPRPQILRLDFLRLTFDSTCTFGNNHLARVYEGRIVDALRNFSTSKTSASPKPSGNEQQYDNVCSIAIWGMYNILL
jgi:hypothetical protein